MDSPESSKTTTTAFTASETAPVQDSPVFSYISNLSPIPPVKASSVTQGFPGLNSPPLVFTSPRLNLQSQPTSLKRVQYPISDIKNSATTIKGNEELDFQLSTRVVASGEKAADSNNSVDELIQSPSASHGQFLEDTTKVDSPDSKFSFDSTIKTSEQNNLPEQTDHQPDIQTCSKEILEKLEHELNTGINEAAAVAHTVVCRQTEKIQNENILFNASEIENEFKQGDGVSVDHSPKIGHDLRAVNALVKQVEDDFITENAETGIAAALDQSSHLLTGPELIVKENENFFATTGSSLTQPTLMELQNDLKAFQNRGVRRRCLQFEDAENNVIYNRPAQDPSGSEGKISIPLEPPLMPIGLKLCPRNILNSSIKIPKPSGIGLHLNSILNTVQAGTSAGINVKTDCVSATTDGNTNESNACVSVGSEMVLPNDSVVLNSKANRSSIGKKRENNELEEVNKLSPKKQRINAIDSGDGCKRCNCKRSKCLKLYCDCFAAGMYCAEPCSCQECFNRPEYEDTVIETRQKIESRDPFAFAPRVVKHAIDQPTISCGEDGSNFTPASARHKKGCKCKKSMCLKKYCECYQANVGCSDGCRCEGCKNVYGQKGENLMTKVAVTGEDAQETTDASFVENFEIAAASGSHTYLPKFVNPHNLTPPTPAFQFSNHGKEASKAWFPSGKYIQSPESSFTYLPPHVMPLETPRNSDNNVTIRESANDILNQESHHGSADSVDEFSSAYPQSGKMGNLSDISNLQKWDQSFLARHSGSSFVWHGSPITPMARFGGMQEVEFDVGLSNSTQDDTPEILKDTSTPLNIVKASSPNKKRVSPPHGHPHEFSSSSSVGVRTRKFTLKAVPSFPPLTPCIDSRTQGMQQDNSTVNHHDNQ